MTGDRFFFFSLDEVYSAKYYHSHLIAFLLVGQILFRKSKEQQNLLGLATYTATTQYLCRIE